MTWVVPNTARAGDLGPTDSRDPGFAMPLSIPFCSQSPGSRWEEACGSTSLTYMSPLAPDLGRGRLPVCLMLLQEHMPTVLSLQSGSRNTVPQATHTPTTRRHTTHTCEHITHSSRGRTFIFAVCSCNNAVVLFKVSILEQLLSILHILYTSLNTSFYLLLSLT